MHLWWGGGGGWRNRCIMLIMTLDPSWRQTLRLPPPGIEPGSPASQAGTLPKELSRHLILWLSYTNLTRSNTQQHTRTPNNRQQHTTTVHNSTRVHKNTNVPLFKKLWDLIFFCGTITLWAISRDILRGPRLFWPLKFRGQKSRGPLKMSREMAHKVIVPQKKIMSQSFLNSGT